ncbi:RES family NAD+ phosphorylase [Pseudomonas asiatica]|uniref:RES family NAD+ phosphorylase n=1 Tax=Pseudomonas asiatica TaxID=2219225 RepID=UPI002E7B2D94|nr:RES family NAD+ phosphorylase [Pseudomonas asiatica]MEE1917526.1 RES family NAD+ phosphorylase [Pseudomonas asiatica]
MICDRCVLTSSLKKFIVESGSFSKCTYCGADGIAINDEKLISYLRDRFIESYSPVDTLSPYDYYMCMESGADEPRAVEYWEPLQDTFELAHPDFIEKAVEALEDELGGNQLFYLNDGSLDNNSYEVQWNNFVWSVHHHQRFFNSDAKNFLDSLFKFTCNNDKLIPEVIVRISNEDRLFRARKADGYKSLLEIEKDPIGQLGPTPNQFASSQRMTPRGISAMYCARDRKTCLSELRPLAGDVMVSGAFVPTTFLDFLNLSKLESISDPEMHPFDPGYTEANNAHHFLKKLVKKISKPNTKKDELAYLATQVVFEYLRSRFSDQVAGLAFPSVQTGLIGQNYVIFPEHCILETTPIAGSALKPPTLAFKKKSIKFHHIKAVVTQTEDFEGSMDYRMNFDL